MDMRKPGYMILLMVIICHSGFSQKLDSAKAKKPIVMLNGTPVTDTLTLNKFDRIDYIRGKKAVDLMGPKAANGIFVISADGTIPVYGEVVDKKGNKIKRAEVMSKEGTVLMITNSCGNFFIPSVRIGERLTIRKKGYQDESILIQQTQQIIQLNRK
jgi:hypothetical protein